ncbi:MAG: enolase C-terminal domain-like protein [Parafilimonas sp.]
MNNKDEILVDEIIKIKDIHVSAYTIPTDFPESDGTIKWNSTTLVLVEINAGDKTGIGFSYADASAAYFIQHTLKKYIVDKNALQNQSITKNLIHQIRNNGNCGIAAMAVSAVDNALWDLKAKLLHVPLCTLLGKVNDAMLLYGSDGFTSYSDKQTAQQFENLASQGITHFKMKVGREPVKDVHRVQAARKAIGDDAKLFVDANGAYSVKQALEKANQFSEYNVSWFEEPVTSDNLQGLHFIKKHAPEIINIAAGEYGYNLPYFNNMLHADAVDILQADATRCGGITTFLKAGSLCESRYIPFSSHCAPTMHLHASLASSSFYIAEYFHDHERIENTLFDGVAQPKDGCLYADISKPGFGIEFKHKDAEKYKV